MRNLSVLLVTLAACGAPIQQTGETPKSEGIRSTIDVTPKNAPSLGGGYEFDLLDAVEGQSCVGPNDTNIFTATIPGFTPTDMGWLETRAEGAALYDAMGKAPGADTLLVTWVKIVSNGDKKCATVHARAVRLRQVDHAAPAAAPPADAKPADPAKPTT